MLLKSMFTSMHSILGWASFCMNHLLLRCNEAQVLYGIQVICIVGSGVSHLDSLWGSGQVSLLANQAQ